LETQHTISLIQKFQSLNLSANIDFDKFNFYAITHHSTTIEGSTLTENETRLLLDEGITPAGKPLLHSLMVKDHFNALLFITTMGKKNKPVSEDFIKAINAAVMQQTGSIYNTVFGQIDATKGIYRKGNVSAGSAYFVSYDKVQSLVSQLCNTLNDKIKLAKTIAQKLEICFDAHFNLVTIHPFYDGNKRTSRLLMNYLQLCFNLPLGIVFKEDKVAYFDALIQTRQSENIKVFQKFMYAQYDKYLLQEIEKYENMNGPKNSNGFSLLL
jgi:Fic family protein